MIGIVFREELCLSTSYADCIPTANHPSFKRLLCLSTSYADCIGKNAQGKAGVYDGRCCESVDSFSIIEER